jgi:hypothetical protein
MNKMTLPWWSTIDKKRLREIQEQKIFKRGEYPKLDAVFSELEEQKGMLIHDLVGHLDNELSMDEKLQWVLDNKAVPVMSRESMGHVSGNKDRKPAKLDAWQNVYLKYQPPATNYVDKEGEKARPLYPTANKILNKYEGIVPIANYSILVKDSIIHRHTGPENRRGHHIRVHIPLYIPTGDIFLEVNGTEVDWSDSFGFNNQYIHSAHNYSFEHRLILLIDFDRRALDIPPGLPFEKMAEITGDPELKYKR